jgi:hypothetical protein
MANGGLPQWRTPQAASFDSDLLKAAFASQMQAAAGWGELGKNISEGMRANREMGLKERLLEAQLADYDARVQGKGTYGRTGRSGGSGEGSGEGNVSSDIFQRMLEAKGLVEPTSDNGVSTPEVTIPSLIPSQSEFEKELNLNQVGNNTGILSEEPISMSSDSGFTPKISGLNAPAIVTNTGLDNITFKPTLDDAKPVDSLESPKEEGLTFNGIVLPKSSTELNPQQAKKIDIGLSDLTKKNIGLTQELKFINAYGNINVNDPATYNEEYNSWLKEMQAARIEFGKRKDPLIPPKYKSKAIQELWDDIDNPEKLQKGFEAHIKSKREKVNSEIETNNKSLANMNTYLEGFKSKKEAQEARDKSWNSYQASTLYNDLVSTEDNGPGIDEDDAKDMVRFANILKEKSRVRKFLAPTELNEIFKSVALDASNSWLWLGNDTDIGNNDELAPALEKALRAKGASEGDLKVIFKGLFDDYEINKASDQRDF